MAKLEIMTVTGACKAWKMNPPAVRKLLRERRVPGAVKHGRDWAIPVTAKRPVDMRRKG